MKLKLPIIIAIVAVAGGAGLFTSGVLGGKEAPGKKHMVEPVALAEPFTINLTDPGGAYLRVALAIQLEPMDAEHWAGFSGANAGGHGGATDAPGPIAIAKYPKFRDGAIRVGTTFSSDDLLTDGGKQEFKDALLTEFSNIAEQDAAETKSTEQDPAHIGIGPPYHVQDIYFNDFVVQG